MKESALYYESRRDEYPYEVWYYTEKQPNKKFKFFHSIEEVKDWCRRHRGKVKIEAASWQVFFAMKGAA